MDNGKIIESFRDRVSQMVQVVPEGIDRFRVSTPFLFDDGDHLSIFLKLIGNRWVLSDEGHTLMHLTYDIDERDLTRGTRQLIITNALTAFGVEDRYGELVLPVADEAYGDALYSFIQAALKISDVTFLSRERVKSAFMEDFHQLMETVVPPRRRQFNWHDSNHDPEGKYVVDCRVNSMKKPLLIFALPNDDKVRDATITLLKLENWGVNGSSVGIFEDQEEINRKVLARFSDICDKQYSSLAPNRERIDRLVSEILTQVQTEIADNDPEELAFWSGRLGTSIDVLRAIISRVGPNLVTIRRELSSGQNG